MYQINTTNEKQVLPNNFYLALQDNAVIIDSDLVGSARVLWYARMAEAGLSAKTRSFKLMSDKEETMRMEHCDTIVKEQLNYPVVLRNLFNHVERGILYCPILDGELYDDEEESEETDDFEDGAYMDDLLTDELYSNILERFPLSMIEVATASGNDGFFTITVYGEDNSFEEIYDEVKLTFLENGYTEPGHRIIAMSCVGGNIQTKNVTIDQSMLGVDSFYPQLSEIDITLHEYFDAFMNSGSNILLLIGAPGTAKSTFIRTLINYTGLSSVICSDIGAVESGAIFSELNDIQSNIKTKSIIALEDIDQALGAREEGNTLMSRFLNETNGICASPIKLIISTNLESTHHIDPALIREGRCFDILQFHRYTPEQAEVIFNQFSLDLPDDLNDRDWNLGEIFSTKEKAHRYFTAKRNLRKQRVGF